MQMVEIHFPPGQRVAFENVREQPVYQQIWLLAGEMEISKGTTVHRLHTGDCLAMVLDRPHMFHNPTKKPARYLVVNSAEPMSRR